SSEGSLEAEALEAPVERRRRDAELAGRALAVAAAQAQHQGDVGPLRAVERFLQREPRRGDLRDIRRELREPDALLAGQDQRALQHVRELAYVATPRVLAERAHRLRRDLRSRSAGAAG